MVLPSKSTATAHNFAEDCVSEALTAERPEVPQKAASKIPVPTTFREFVDTGVHSHQPHDEDEFPGRDGSRMTKKVSLFSTFLSSNQPLYRGQRQHRVNPSRSECQRRRFDQLRRQAHHQFTWRHLHQTGMAPLGQKSGGGDACCTDQLTETIVR